MEKIGIIVNPHAKKNKKQNPVNLFKEIAGGYAEVRISNSLNEITEIAKDFKKQKITYLAISGGDGSIHHVLSKFMTVYKPDEIPPIIILKCGTMNTISRTINLNGTGPQILKRVIDTINSGKKIKLYYRDTIKVVDRCCFLFGMGLAANFISEYNHGGYTGPIKAVWVLLRGVFGGIFGLEDVSLFKRLLAKVNVDENEIDYDDFFCIFATTVEDIGISFRPMYRALEKEDTFHFIATGMKPSEFVKKVLKFRSGKKVIHPLLFDNIAKKVTINGPERYEYMMDGDTFEHGGELIIRIGPRIPMVYV